MLNHLPQIVLASASPARKQLLQNVGITPIIEISALDEDQISRENKWQTPAEIASGLALAKAQAIASRITESAIVIGCDSVMEFAGKPYGKPDSPAQAEARLAMMSGGEGNLFTGHAVIWKSFENGTITEKVECATTSTLVRFAELSQAEIKSYVATEEPLYVAGSYTIDSLGGVFIREIVGDPSNVVGLSLPTLRNLFSKIGIGWELVLNQAKVTPK